MEPAGSAAEQRPQEEHDVGGAFREPTHQIPVPLLAEGHVDPDGATLSDQTELLTLASTRPLAFGKFIAGSGGSITIAPNGARSRATVRGGTFHANTTAGLNLTGVGNAEATLIGVSLTNNPTGVVAGSAPNIVRLGQTLIYGNSTSLTGNVKGWAGNFIDGNTANNLPIAPNLP